MNELDRMSRRTQLVSGWIEHQFQSGVETGSVKRHHLKFTINDRKEIILKHFKPLRAVLGLAATVVLAGVARADGPAIVKLGTAGDRATLTVDGQPFYIKGAGGDYSKKVLKEAGGNSFRTWGAGGIDNQLEEAQRLGLKVTIGIWLGHKEHGFNYHNADAVAHQLEDARHAVMNYRNSPALLIWDLGNEMENGFPDDDPAVWNAIEDIAKMTKQLDPNHPTMTTVAEIGGNKVAMINKYCPDIDIVGINSYGGGPSLGDRYKKAGGVKPYIITEFGPPGTWEIGRNAWGVANELTSTEKAKFYQLTYDKAIGGNPNCLGSYAFAWGNKNEATATWYGLYLSDGTRLQPVDVLQQEWTGKAPAIKCPTIDSYKIDGPAEVEGGATVKASIDITDPQRDPIKIDWVLSFDPATYNTGGANEAMPATYPDAIVAGDSSSVTVKMPPYQGGYRLYAFVHDAHGDGAVANLPLHIAQGAAPPPPPARKAALPLVLFGPGSTSPYIPSGYMGNTGAIHMDFDWPTNPHSGRSSIKVQYSANGDWGGVIWQNPDNNWGEKGGGYDLTGATKLTFWARGETGDERVTFVSGLIGDDKPFHDTNKAKLDGIKLTQDWKQYTIDIAGKDLTRIVSGFGWTVGGQGAPVTFYLDDIRYE